MTQKCKFCGTDMVLVRCKLERFEDGLRSVADLWVCDRFMSSNIGCNAVCRHDKVTETKVWISRDNEVSIETKN